MREIVSITSHPNSTHKLELLFECIKTIKNQNFDIILNSHIHVPNYLVELVDYYVYDKENPLIHWYEFDQYGSISFWLKSAKFSINKFLDFNHGYSVLKLLRNSAQIAKANGYNKIHFVDYDYLIKDENLLQTHSNILNDYQGYFYTNSGNLVSGFFSMRVNDFLELFSEINSREKYSSYQIPVLENLIFDILNKNNFNYFTNDIQNILEKNEVDLVNQNQIYGLYEVENYLVRLIFCSDGQKYYLYSHSSKEDTENKINIFCKGNIFVSDVSTNESFIELPQNFVNDGFECNFSKKRLSLIFNSNSNIANCEIIDKTLIKKIKL